MEPEENKATPGGCDYHEMALNTIFSITLAISIIFIVIKMMCSVAYAAISRVCAFIIRGV